MTKLHNYLKTKGILPGILFIVFGVILYMVFSQSTTNIPWYTWTCWGVGAFLNLYWYVGGKRWTDGQG